MTAADRALHFQALKLASGYLLAFCLGVAFTVTVQAVLS
ncbi:hypothetical protein DFO63_4081 [Stenotrophomonas sp. AG209]|nr:hypothetical protein DFO63_4081 [Stenotrophomonas sp. AG209]